MKQIILIFVLCISIAAGAQQYLGVQTWGGTGSDQLSALALDAQGRIFATGAFRNTADMDPGPGDWPLSATAGQDIFLSRFTADAQFEWSVKLGGTGHDFAPGSAVHDDAVFIGGEFEGTLEADGVILNSNGDSDALLAKFSAEGVLLWAISAGGTGSDYINDIAVDDEGNVIAIGYFQGTMDVDPGPDVLSVSASGADAMFLWKLSPAGALIWVRTWNGTSSENGLAVAVDAQNDIWLSGGYYGTLDLDPGDGLFSVTASSFDQDAFLIRMDAAGQFLWGGSMGGNGTDVVQDLKIDANGDVIAIGHFGDTADLDPGAGTATHAHLGGPDSFVLKLSPEGDLIWSASFGSNGYDVPNAVVIGPAGELMITGGFDGTIDLDPGTGTANFSTNGGADVYKLLLSSGGQFLQGATWGGTGFDDGTAVAWSALDRRFIGGLFEYTADFDPGPGADMVSSLLNSRDAFLSRMCMPFSIEADTLICLGDSIFAGGEWQHESGAFSDVHTAVSGCDSTIITNLAVEICTGRYDHARETNMQLFPVPAHDRITLILDVPSSGEQLEIFDAQGKMVYRELLSERSEYSIPLAGLVAGPYTLRISGMNEGIRFMIE